MNNKAIIFSIIYIFLVFAINPAIALSLPDTAIVAGPSGHITYNDVAFWWTGKTIISDGSDRLPSIKGFYYSLDGEPWNWTQDRYITYYDLPKGEHKFYVKAVDSNDQQDTSPAFRTFTIELLPIIEANEGQAIFTDDAAKFQGDLNNKFISAELRQEFALKGITISTDATVAIITKDSEWQITDVNKTYYLKEDDKISAYGPINDSATIATIIPVNKAIKCESFHAKEGVDEDWFKISIERDAQTFLMPRQMAIMFKSPAWSSSTDSLIQRQEKRSPALRRKTGDSLQLESFRVTI
jgi:hypothetical protein